MILHSTISFFHKKSLFLKISNHIIACDLRFGYPTFKNSGYAYALLKIPGLTAVRFFLPENVKNIKTFKLFLKNHKMVTNIDAANHDTLCTYLSKKVMSTLGKKYAIYQYKTGYSIIKQHIKTNKLLTSTQLSDSKLRVSTENGHLIKFVLHCLGL